MDLIIDTKTVTEAGFDGNLIKPVETEESGELRYVDPNSLVGGTIGSMGVLYVGSKQIRIDSRRGNMVWNDGTEDVITLGKLDDGSFGIDVADGKINGAWIVANSITADQIEAGTITATEIKAGTITTTEIAANTIEAGDIKANTITASEIAAGTITTTEIKAGTIEASDIKTGTITATQIAAGAIDTDELAADAVTASKIDVTDLAAINADLGSITAGTVDFSGSGSNYITLPYGTSSTGHLRWNSDSNKIWVDSSGYMGLQASGGRIYFYSGANIMGLFQYGTGLTSYDDIGCQGIIYPTADDTYDLGTINKRWDDVYATNGTIQTSDRRDKEDIRESNLGLDFINKLVPKSFKRKGKKRKHYGLIAQEVEDILGKEDFAGLIKDKESGKYGLRYEEFIAPMVKAIQELSEKVEELEKKL